MGKSILHRAMRLLARAQAFEPVRHVLCCEVINSHRRNSCLARQKNILRRALFIDVGIVLVIALFFDQLVAWAALAPDVDEHSLFPHIAREAGRVISETGGIADQKPFGYSNSA